MQTVSDVLKRLFIFAVWAGLLTACSPTFDWRTVRSDDMYYEAMFPGKPSRAEKTLSWKQQKLRMTMEASKTGDALYAVGVIELGQATNDQVEGVINFLSQGLLSNIKSDAAIQVTPKSVKTAGQPSYELPVLRYRKQGVGPDGHERLLHVMYVQRRHPDGQTMIYQVSVLQTVGGSNQHLEEHQQFLDSFKPY